MAPDLERIKIDLTDIPARKWLLAAIAGCESCFCCRYSVLPRSES